MYRTSYLSFLVIAVCLLLPTVAQAAEPKADPVTFLGLPVTTSIVTAWVFSILLIILIRVAGGRPTMIPSRGQAVLEAIIVGLRDIIRPIVGEKVIKPVFPLLIGLFLFILFHNWSGLMPGVGSIGMKNEEGVMVLKFLRPGNTDLSLPLAIAIVTFVAWLYFCIRYAGIKALVYDIFGNKADKKTTAKAIYISLIPIFLFVGVIEIISIAFRPVALSLRLYGNMFGGENLLLEMTNFVAFIVPIPFYFFEIMVGVIQAAIFTMLVAIYIGLVCNHPEGEGEHGH
ncbi:MAG: F0F1 ATP synthase subunit A [Opitutales bacterium]|nr:F0F1 ATP synthase subunit A [Opitutales bacterium]